MINFKLDLNVFNYKKETPLCENQVVTIWLVQMELNDVSQSMEDEGPGSLLACTSFIRRLVKDFQVRMVTFLH